MMLPLKHSKSKQTELWVSKYGRLAPSTVGKYLYTDHWIKDKMTATKHGQTTMKRLAKQGKIVRAECEKVIYVSKGADKRRGFKNYAHEIDLRDFLACCERYGYDTQIGGFSKLKPDGVIRVNGKYYAVELDRGYHSLTDLNDQVHKYCDLAGYEKALFISASKGMYTILNRENQELQVLQEKKLREDIRKRELPKAIEDRLLFATYSDAANPLKDPLKTKHWKTLRKGKYQSVLQ